MQPINHGLKYGLDQNKRLVHVSKVSSGLGCNCICPACLCKLVAKKGTEVEWHFAHYCSEMCAYARETVLHMLAKQIIGDAKKIWLPQISLGLAIPNANILIREAGNHNVENALTECRVGNIIPDVILKILSTKLIVELFVTHAVDDIKLEKIRRLGISAIEIDLRNMDIDDYNALAKILLEKTYRKRWLYSNLAVKKSKRYLKKCINLQPYKSSFVNCPILIRSHYRNNPDADYQTDCQLCQFCLGYDNTTDTIFCLGENLIIDEEDFELDIRVKKTKHTKLCHNLRILALDRIRQQFMNTVEWKQQKDSGNYYTYVDDLCIKLIKFEEKWGVTVNQKGENACKPKWDAGLTFDEARLTAFEMIRSVSVQDTF